MTQMTKFPLAAFMALFAAMPAQAQLDTRLAGHEAGQVEIEKLEHERSIILSRDFFDSPLAGGVETQAPLYSYRGYILISANGQVSYGHRGLAHATLQIRAMDEAPLIPPRPFVRRVVISEQRHRY